VNQLKKGKCICAAIKSINIKPMAKDLGLMDFNIYALNLNYTAIVGYYETVRV
jgi:hypothetical protein